MWNVTIQVEGKDVCFKLDTGAEVTVVGEKVMHSLDSKRLQTPTKRLCGPDQTPLDVLGELTVTLIYKNRSHNFHCEEPPTEPSRATNYQVIEPANSN